MSGMVLADTHQYLKNEEGFKEQTYSSRHISIFGKQPAALNSKRLSKQSIFRFRR